MSASGEDRPARGRGTVAVPQKGSKANGRRAALRPDSTGGGESSLVLNQRLVEAAEKERRAIGREIHDDLGQQLHGLQYLAGLLKQDLAESGSPYASDAERLARLLSETMIMARHLANGLQPVMPVPEGLMTALGELARRTTEVYRIDCVFNCPKPVALADVVVATHLYRIAQEATNNAVRHAGPRHIRLSLRLADDQLLLRVADDGQGIPAQRNGSAGMGLHIMHQRAGLLAGTLVIQHRGSGGTDIVVTVPRPVTAGSDHPFGDAL